MNGKPRVVYDEVPNPRYNEYICYISPFLCLRGQKLQKIGLPGPVNSDTCCSNAGRGRGRCGAVLQIGAAALDSNDLTLACLFVAPADP